MAPKKNNENKQKKVTLMRPHKRTFFQYDADQIKNALNAIRGGMKIQTACKLFDVPRTTIRHKLSGRAPETTGKIGKSPVLGRDIEKGILEWIKNMAKMGFPVCQEALLFSVKKLVEENKMKTPFNKDTPRRKWFQMFMSRHPDISLKQSEYINRARALITEKIYDTGLMKS